jgi:hypothetical protein
VAIFAPEKVLLRFVLSARLARIDLSVSFKIFTNTPALLRGCAAPYFASPNDEISGGHIYFGPLSSIATSQAVPYSYYVDTMSVGMQCFAECRALVLCPSFIRCADLESLCYR